MPSIKKLNNGIHRKYKNWESPPLLREVRKPGVTGGRSRALWDLDLLKTLMFLDLVALIARWFSNMKIQHTVHICAHLCVKSEHQSEVFSERRVCIMFSVCIQCSVYGHSADQSNIPHSPWLIEQVGTFYSYNKSGKCIIEYVCIYISTLANWCTIECVCISFPAYFIFRHALS